MHRLRNPLIVCLGVGLLGAGMLAAQEPGEVANAGDADATPAGDLDIPSPAQMRTSSQAVVDELRRELERFAELRTLARASKDILKLSCVNDKMLLYKQVINLAEDARAEMNEALIKRDTTGAERSYLQVADSGRRGLELRTAAEGCIGAELMFVGPRLDVISPVIDDLDAHQWFDLDDPKYATPFNYPSAPSERTTRPNSMTSLSPAVAGGRAAPRAKSRAVLFAIVAAAALAGPAVANAQTSQILGRDWEEVVTGPGIKVGEGTVVHPIAGVETGVISNVFYEEDTGRTAGMIRVVGEAAFASLPQERLEDPERTSFQRPLWRRWTGSIYQAHDGPFWRPDDGDSDGATDDNPGALPRLEFRAGARAYYEEYLSGESIVRAQRNLGLNGNLHLHLFPYDLIAFTIDDDLTRAIRPTNFESDRDLDRWINHLRLAMRVQAGGRALIPELRVHNRVDVFESGSASFANRLQTTLGGRLNWWFTRFTRLYADASIGFFGGLGGGSAGIDKIASRPLRTIVGGRTPLTRSTAVDAHVGFAKGFYAAGADFTGPLVSATFTWRHNDLGRSTIGYRYDFQDSINANFYSQHGISARVSQQIRRVLVEGTAALYLRHYDGVPMALGGGPTRDDVILAVGANGRYLLRDWLGITGQLHVATDQTGFRTNVGGEPDDPSFTRFELFAGVVSAF